MVNKALTFLVLSCLAAVCSACWIPEQFDATVLVAKDGSYTVTYSGTLTFALALAASRQGQLGAQDEAKLKQEAAKMAREAGFKTVEYQGKGRYKVLVEKQCSIGEAYYFPSKELKVFAVVSQPDRSVSVSAVPPDKKAIQELASIGATIDGTLTVSVAPGATVVKHNAHSQPSVFGLLRGYKWRIKSPDEKPFILIQPQSFVGFGLGRSKRDHR